jgi:Tol biopolymer transport system component
VRKWLFAGLILSGICAAQVTLKPFLSKLDGDVYDSEISPGGDTVAFTWCRRVDGAYSCGVYSRAIRGGEPRLLFKESNIGELPLELQWSRDGKWLAYTAHLSHNNALLFIRSSNGGPPKQIARVCEGGFSWTGDSRGLIASSSSKPEWDSDHCNLTFYPLEGSATHIIAKRGGSPAVSPDGHTMAFNLGDRIMLQDLANSQARGPARTLSKVEALADGPYWIAGGRELLYTTQEWTPLHRIAITPGAKPITISGIDDHTEIRQLKAAATGAIIAEIDRHDAAVWRMDLHSTNPAFEKLQSLPYAVEQHRVSPDGVRVAFVGSGGIWTSDLVGANKKLVTYHREVILNPRWSPDGQTIAFTGLPSEGNADMRSRVYVVAAAGGKPRRLLSHRDDVEFLDWSRDGKFLYLSRDPGEKTMPSQKQLWKIELVGDRLIQITSKDGGNHAEESIDGKTLYFTNSVYSKLRSVSASGGDDVVLSNTELSPVFGGAFSVGAEVIYFVPENRRNARVSILKLTLPSKEVHEIATPPFEPLTIQLSRDERYLFATSRPNPITSRVLIEGIN